MIPATQPSVAREATRLLVIESNHRTFRDALMVDLPNLLQRGDLLVVNDAATLPASLFARTASGLPVEIRLLHHLGDSDWDAILFGAGDWRTPTELRDPPKKLALGATLQIGKDFAAELVALIDDSGRLVRIRFSRTGAGMWTGIYAHGRPIQYSYLKSNLALWSVQTAYASRPLASEMPSSGHSLSWRILLELKKRGIRVAWLTHAAGISAIGDQTLEARLPFPEDFEIPPSTADAIADTSGRGGRVIAVGTTVTRALEGCSVQHGGRIVAGAGTTDLVLGPQYRRSKVDGILTGLHDAGQSHFQLLSAFVDEITLRQAWQHAEDIGYRGHEFGDLCLIV
jgi:S-adenosylmethionine:tRNA ribosyltransferase-isomerase